MTRSVELPSEDAARFFTGLAAAIRGIRARDQLTRREVAARAGLGKRLVSDIENERANPRFTHLDQLAQSLGHDNQSWLARTRRRASWVVG